MKASIQMLKTGDLVYVPLTDAFFEISFVEPTNLLLASNSLTDKKYLKVLYDGDEWYVDRADINEIGGHLD